MELTPKDAELVIGLVARIGVDTKKIVGHIKAQLKEYNYNVHEIHVTDLLKAFEAKLTLSEFPSELRYNSYIDACNKLRADTSVDVMAKLAIMHISGMRLKIGDEPSLETRTAYIVNQIKRPEEFELLRQVYGEHYVQISCHADDEIRIARLKSRISDDHPENPKNSDWDIVARQLVHKDESEEEVKFGQRVRQVFPLSDVIIDANAVQTSERGIERFFRALFGDKSVTPTREEYGMEMANTAAQRSSDLSRQVGAAILNRSMEVQALGSNEVPKAGGGTYWEGDDPDGRDFALGRDSNEQRRRAVLLDVVLRLQKAGALAAELKDSDTIKKFLFDREDNLIADSQLMDSLEYGRSVHAEMNAITDAARGGHAIRGCKLFSNTFPCHNCAKHIVASGISEVIYNYPYPKSYASELFADSIEVNPSRNPLECLQISGENSVSNKVIFRQFIGIVGPIYSRLFTKARWKKVQGEIPLFLKQDASYIRRTPTPGYDVTETIIGHLLQNSLFTAKYLSSI